MITQRCQERMARKLAVKRGNLGNFGDRGNFGVRESAEETWGQAGISD